ncbi:hypothetical protein [Sphingomonas sp. BAUL-RG-20F-R05-02]|uniref:hypothetical protein n=1 Tax=Sphingomonas sp. BAUL-RG-20F-R05-02 TaxID=2914830 RepID=UPI001F57F765|nr:hypothetical protein [Sphingomonas sp. BAUL-RG-20F-R05-02]
MSTKTNEPQPARAIFSSEDFTLIRNAVAKYLQDENAPDTVKYANLYHRLGRMASSR